MARFSHIQPKSSKDSNPSTKWLQWKSTQKRLCYFDKELKEDVFIDGPIKFVLLNQYSTIKGWSDPIGAPIWSNEVFAVGQEPVTVMITEPKDFTGAKKDLFVAEGLWNKIKPEALVKGAVYYKSIYVMLEDGSIANISIKASANGEWSKFCKEFGGGFDNPNFDDKWLEITGPDNRKKGSINYSVPVFALGKKLTASQDKMANEASEILSQYMHKYLSRNQEDAKEVIPEIPADALDF